MTAAVLISGLAIAQEPPPPNGPLQGPDNGADVPSRAARLSFLSGQVSFQPASVEDWVPATLNRPLTTGDRLFTDNGARAELNTGTAVMRLNGRSNFSFVSRTYGNGESARMAARPAHVSSESTYANRGTAEAKS